MAKTRGGWSRAPGPGAAAAAAAVLKLVLLLCEGGEKLVETRSSARPSTRVRPLTEDGEARLQGCYYRLRDVRGGRGAEAGSGWISSGADPGSDWKKRGETPDKGAG